MSAPEERNTLVGSIPIAANGDDVICEGSNQIWAGVANVWVGFSEAPVAGVLHVTKHGQMPDGAIGVEGVQVGLGSVLLGGNTVCGDIAAATRACKCAGNTRSGSNHNTPYQSANDCGIESARQIVNMKIERDNRDRARRGEAGPDRPFATEDDLLDDHIQQHLADEYISFVSEHERWSDTQRSGYAALLNDPEATEANARIDADIVGLSKSQQAEVDIGAMVREARSTRDHAEQVCAQSKADPKVAQPSQPCQALDAWNQALFQRVEALAQQQDQTQKWSQALERDKQALADTDREIDKKIQSGSYRDLHGNPIRSRSQYNAALAAARADRERFKVSALKHPTDSDPITTERWSTGGSWGEEQAEIIGRETGRTPRVERFPKDDSPANRNIAMDQIEKAIREGNVVIAHVDVLNLWDTKQKGSHAIVVSGVEYDDNGNVVGVIFNDTGLLGCHARVEATKFKSAIRLDGNGQMVAVPS